MPNEVMLPGRIAEDPEGPSSSLRDVASASFRLINDVNNLRSREEVLSDEFDKRIAKVERVTGVRLFHPRRDRPTDADYAEAKDEMPDGFWYRRARPDEAMVTAAAERRFHRELDKLREQNPDKAAEIGTQTVWDDAGARLAKIEQLSADVTRRSPLTVPESVPIFGGANPAAMAGGLAGFFHTGRGGFGSLSEVMDFAGGFNFENIAITMATGLSGSAARSVLWNAARQAAANAGQQALSEPFVQAWRKEAGLDYGWGEAATNIKNAALFGGAIDLAGRSAARTFMRRPLSGVREPVKPGDAPPLAPANDAGPASADMAAPGAVSAPEGARSRDLDAALEAGARRLPPDNLVRRAAEGDRKATIELAEKLGPHFDDPDALRGALEQFKAETLQNEGVAAFLAEANLADRKAALVRSFDIDEEIGRHLEHIEDPQAVPPPGAPHVIARPEAPVPETPLTQALRDGDLPPVAAAEAIRAQPELAHLVELTTDLGRGIHSLTRLSDEGFARVVDGAVSPEWAALVADAAPPGRHAELLDRLAAAAPRDGDAARRVLAEALQRPTDASTAHAILGVESPREAPARQRLGAPEFEEPLGDGAKLQAESLKGLEDRAAGIEDLQAKLRLFGSKQKPLERYRSEGVLAPEDLPGRFSWKEPPKAGTFQMFHATDRDFARFDMAKSQDFGVHFGTAEQAANRIKATARAENARTIPVTVDVQNAIALPDQGYWGPREVGKALTKAGIEVTDAERAHFDELAKAIDRADALGATAKPALRKAVIDANQAIRDKLNAAGIDGIWYRNDHEGAGWSLLVWNEGQVRNAITGERMMRLRDGGSLGDTAYSPAFRAAETAIGAELAAAAEKTLPRGVALELADRLRVGAYELDGYFDRRNNILAVALDSADPAFTFNHERIHALKAHGLFSDAEWGLLVAEAEKRGMRQEMGRDALEHYRQQLTPAMVKEALIGKGINVADLPWAEIEPLLVKAKLLDPKDVRGSLERHGLWDEARLQDMIDEEAVAFLAEGYRQGGALSKGAADLFARIEAFLERVRNVLAGHGFQTLDDVFHRIDTGEVAERATPQAELRAELESATIDADAGALVQACKLF